MTSNAPKARIESLLDTCIRLGASDMHLSCNEPVNYRIHGRLTPDGDAVLDAACIESMADCVMTMAQKQVYDTSWTVDLGYSNENGERFRINCYRTMGKPAMAVRHLDQSILSFQELGLPAELRELALLQSGLVLVTGVTGSGKSTTLALLLDEINRQRNCHILTVEDPVEFVHESRKSLVHHREVHTDVPNFADAVRAGLREDPDVIMVGEMRDLETMQTSMIAAETGHLVFSTLHTGTAVGAVERFIGAFSGEEQSMARHRFSMVLRAVVAQQLLIVGDGQRRVPAIELLKINHAAAHMIRTSKTEQLLSLMEAGAVEGMWTLDQYLARLVRNNKLPLDVALKHCHNLEAFEALVGSTQVGGGKSWR